jgi:hypothetical protein
MFGTKAKLKQSFQNFVKADQLEAADGAGTARSKNSAVVQRKMTINEINLMK